jgi:hypothetical protein
MSRKPIPKTARERRLIRALDLPAADIVAMDAMLSEINVAIAIVPGDPIAKSMTDLFIRHGFYRSDATSFTAREGGDPLTARGKRIFALIPDRRGSRNGQ